MTVAVVSGGFDPLHVGHVRLVEGALLLPDVVGVVVILNTDDWLREKKGYLMSPWEDRRDVVGALRGVGAVYPGGDADGSVCRALRAVADDHWPLVFCNGGDRGRENTPEQKLCAELGIGVEFGVGGTEKAESSSVMVQRKWGHYRDLLREKTRVLKELVLWPGRSISYQRHIHRNEFWYVESGRGLADFDGEECVLEPGMVGFVPKGCWHQITALGSAPLVVTELQYGGECREDDIVRSVK